MLQNGLKDATKQLDNVIDILNKLPWICSICNQDLSVSSMGCDDCNTWFHLSCLEVKSAPKISWLCMTCIHK